jgi:hypothetical protein
MHHDLNTNGIDSATRRHFNIKGNIDTTIKGIFIRRLRGYINFAGQHLY